MPTALCHSSFSIHYFFQAPAFSLLRVSPFSILSSQTKKAGGASF